MPATKDSPKHRPSIGRLSIGSNVVLQVLLGVFLFGFVNFLSWKNYKRWDLTVNSSHTLSERTVNYLKSMEKRARMIVLFTRGTQLTTNVYNLVDEYKRHSGKKLKVDFVDPAREPNRLEEIKDKYKLQFADRKDGILVEMETADGTSQTRFVTEDQFIQQNPRTGRIDAFVGEAVLTSAFLALSEGRKKVLKLVTGRGGLGLGDHGKTAMDFLQDFARKENGEVQLIDISDPDADLKSADILIFINIKDDLVDAEVTRLEEYWESKRGSLLVLLNPEYPTPKLAAFLKEYGVIVRNDRVVETISDTLKTRTNYEVTSVIPPGTTIMDSLLWGRNVRFGGMTQSIEIDELHTDDLKDRGIVVQPLLQTDYRRFWGETEFFNEHPQFDEKEDSRLGPLTGVFVEMGVVKDAKLRIESSRMVVLGNATLLDPTMDTASYDLATSVINWMLDRDELVGIAPKQKQWFRLEISDLQSRRIFQIVVLALPLSVVFFGLFVWGMRRA